MFNRRVMYNNPFNENVKHTKRNNIYSRIINEAFSDDEPVFASINIVPNTELDVEPGEEVTPDTFTDPDDDVVAELVSLVDTAVIDDITGDNSYKLVVSVSEPDSAEQLYDWITTYTNTKNDEDIEKYVAPGLIDLMNSKEDVDGLENIEDAEEYVVDDDESYDDLDELADETNAYNEAVSSNFSKYRNLFESAVDAVDEEDALNEKGDEDGSSDDDFADLFGGEDNDKKDDEPEEDDSKNSDSEEGDSDDDSEEVPMTAVVLTIKRDDIDKCKDEMISAGISDEDIEVLDGDEDDENAKLKIDVNSVKELKAYLEGKGIDLEEKIGGEIIDDEDDGKDSDSDDKDDEDPSDYFDMNDLFGDDESDADDSDDK